MLSFKFYKIVALFLIQLQIYIFKKKETSTTKKILFVFYPSILT